MVKRRAMAGSAQVGLVGSSVQLIGSSVGVLLCGEMGCRGAATAWVEGCCGVGKLFWAGCGVGAVVLMFFVGSGSSCEATA